MQRHNPSSSLSNAESEALKRYFGMPYRMSATETELYSRAVLQHSPASIIELAKLAHSNWSFQGNSAANLLFLLARLQIWGNQGSPYAFASLEASSNNELSINKVSDATLLCALCHAYGFGTNTNQSEALKLLQGVITRTGSSVANYHHSYLTIQRTNKTPDEKLEALRILASAIDSIYKCHSTSMLAVMIEQQKIDIPAMLNLVNDTIRSGIWQGKDLVSAITNFSHILVVAKQIAISLLSDAPQHESNLMRECRQQIIATLESLQVSHDKSEIRANSALIEQVREFKPLAATITQAFLENSLVVEEKIQELKEVMLQLKEEANNLPAGKMKQIKGLLNKLNNESTNKQFVDIYRQITDINFRSIPVDEKEKAFFWEMRDKLHQFGKPLLQPEPAPTFVDPAMAAFIPEVDPSTAVTVTFGDEDSKPVIQIAADHLPPSYDEFTRAQAALTADTPAAQPAPTFYSGQSALPLFAAQTNNQPGQPAIYHYSSYQPR